MIHAQVTKPFKLGCCLGAALLIWILYSYRDIPEPDIPGQPVMPAPALLTTRAPDPVLRVDVYYECLCPDSRYNNQDCFINKSQGGVRESKKNITAEICHVAGILS